MPALARTGAFAWIFEVAAGWAELVLLMPRVSATAIPAQVDTRNVDDL
jgi:hypothetical protein